MGRVKYPSENLICKKCGFRPWGLSPDKCEQCGSKEFWLFDEIHTEPEKPVFAETWIAPEKSE